MEFLKSFINKTTTFNSDEFKLGLSNVEIFASKFQNNLNLGFDKFIVKEELKAKD